MKSTGTRTQYRELWKRESRGGERGTQTRAGEMPVAAIATDTKTPLPGLLLLLRTRCKCRCWGCGERGGSESSTRTRGDCGGAKGVPMPTHPTETIAGRHV